MKRIISPILRKLFLTGINSKNTRIENKKIILVNQIASIIIITNIVFSTTILFYNLYVGFTLLFVGFLNFIPLYCNQKNHYIAARNIMMFLATSNIGVFSYTLGFSSGTVFYFFPIIIAMGYAFPYKHIKELLFQLSLVIGVLTFLINQHYHETSEVLNKGNLIFWINFVYSFIYSALIIILYSYRSQKELETYAKKLELRKKGQLISEKSIKDKEILIAEIHHRVKNNLAVITSMINLQIAEDIQPEAKDVLEECSNRILSMSLIHEKLYSNSDLSNLNIKEYIVSLTDELYSSYNSKKNIEIDISVEDFFVNINQAVPIGLILNELISNAFKHAFTNIENGKLSIKCNVVGKQIILNVNDNGKGFDLEKIERKPTLGLTIIESLTEQLDGTSDFNSKIGSGTQFIISFSKYNS